MMERSHRETLILGVGNPLRRDDGIGPAVIQLLEEKRVSYEISDDIELIDGGTDGLGLIEYLKDYKKVIIIDAVEMNLPPGTVKLFTPEEASISINKDSLSTHGFGIAELIKLAKALDINTELIIAGVQPEDMNYGEGLSESVNSSMNVVINTVLETVQ
ncbi:MAG: hydrogenase maturation protease [Spirochaetaceae bacterium]|nr:hydrogenase maturation protease [Spirochaetaceae bacterium]